MRGLSNWRGPAFRLTSLFRALAMRRLAPRLCNTGSISILDQVPSRDMPAMDVGRSSTYPEWLN